MEQEKKEIRVGTIFNLRTFCEESQDNIHAYLSNFKKDRNHLKASCTKHQRSFICILQRGHHIFVPQLSPFPPHYVQYPSPTIILFSYQKMLQMVLVLNSYTDFPLFTPIYRRHKIFVLLARIVYRGHCVNGILFPLLIQDTIYSYYLPGSQIEGVISL